MRLATIVDQKVTPVTSHPLYCSMCSTRLLLVQMQVANIDTTHKQKAQQSAFLKVV